MKKVLIINASGFGREVYWLVRELVDKHENYTIKGFLDNRSNILQGYHYEHPIISSVENYQPEADDVFVCAIALPEDKLKYSQMIKKKGGVFINIIHQSALLSANITFGEGVIISSRCGISCDVHIGNFVTMNALSTVGHDAYIHDYVHVNSYCSISGGAELGELSIIHPHAVILPKTKVGRGSVVGAGSVVIKNVPDKTTVLGVPAMSVGVYG